MERRIENCVNEIWSTYDKDNSGFLDKRETRAFIKSQLGKMGLEGEIPEALMDMCFQAFDKDGSGTVTRDEMRAFLKQMMSPNDKKSEQTTAPSPIARPPPKQTYSTFSGVVQTQKAPEP